MGEFIADSYLGARVSLFEVILSVFPGSGDVRILGDVPREVETTIVKPEKQMEEHLGQVTSFRGKCLDHHGEAQLRSNLDVPLSIEFSFPQKLLIRKNEDNADIYKGLVENEGEYGFVFDCSAILVFISRRQDEYLLSDHVNRYNYKRLAIHDDMPLSILFEPVKTHSLKLVFKDIPHFAETIALQFVISYGTTAFPKAHFQKFGYFILLEECAICRLVHLELSI